VGSFAIAPFYVGWYAAFDDEAAEAAEHIGWVGPVRVLHD
jgi:hypothetical protein